jgi:hypothetical protein
MTYDIVQTTFLLSMAANGASGIAASQSKLQKHLEIYLNGSKPSDKIKYKGFFPEINSQLAGGDWEVVWGPCVYSIDGELPGEATNAMYVAHSANLSAYVVAIAATNFKSIYDWAKEDGDVSPEKMARWPLTVPFDERKHAPFTPPLPPAISAATARGVSILLTKLNDPGKGSIQNFLASRVSDNETLIFCGHSLAGALSPTLALHLYGQPAKSGWKQVLVLPTAGATPGNSEFAALFSAAYPPVGSGVNAAYGNWNTDYANARDVVPHAWNQLDKVIITRDDKGKYLSMYGVMDKLMGESISWEISRLQAEVKDGYYTNLTQSVFQPDWGYWNWKDSKGHPVYPPVWEAAPIYTNENAMFLPEQLLHVIRYAHVDQYQRFFGVSPLPPMPTSFLSEI